MTWQTFAFIIVAGIAFGYSGLKFKILIDLLKGHRGKKPRLNQIPARVKTTIANVLGQKAVNQKQPIGLVHSTIFWGFIIITVGTLEQFASTLHRDWSLEFLGETLYHSLLAIQDFFVAAILLAVGYAFYRRLVVKPPGLGKSRDANIVLTFTGGLMISILLMNAFHIRAANPTYQEALWVSRHLADAVTHQNLSTAAYETLATVFKWIHMLLVLGFAMYIPNSKHLHIVAAGPNTFLRNLPREKGMTPIDFTNEAITQYGAAKVTDLSPKDGLDYYSCTECGRCQDLCPAWNTGKPLSPKKLILDLKNNMYRNKEKILAGKQDEVEHIIDGEVTEDVIWA